MELGKRHRRVRRARQNEQRRDVFLTRPGRAFCGALDDEYDRPNISGDGLRKRWEKRSERVRGFRADMSGNRLSQHGHPLAAGMELAEPREP